MAVMKDYRSVDGMVGVMVKMMVEKKVDKMVEGSAERMVFRKVAKTGLGKVDKWVEMSVALMAATLDSLLVAKKAVERELRTVAS